jgi:hypothetical protein
MSHIDDFEISCLSYLFKHKDEYRDIKCIVATTWDAKKEIWKENLSAIEEKIQRKISYENLGFEQRKMQTNLDDIKNSLYGKISFDKSSRFDIISHDFNDCHTDHLAAHLISKGLYKYSDRFITVYSPSSSKFDANYWINLTDEDFEFKKLMLDKYDINVEQSYTKLGYYLQSEKHYDIGSAYYLENFVHKHYNHYECYRILKWS